MDRALLDVEDGPLHMHVGVVAVFAGGGLVDPGGALDVRAVRASISASLAQVPRFRQRVHELPLLGSVWMEDPDFRIDRHVIHTAVPRPGTRAQLDALAGRLFSQRLDRERPLWEMWLVEGLEDGRFAVITKAHHAMLDGVEAVGVLAALFSFAPRQIEIGGDTRTGVRDEARVDRNALARALIDQRISELPKAAARVRDLFSVQGRRRLRDALEGGVRVARDALTPTPVTALNPARIGPERAFGGRRLPLERMKQVRRASGATLNDVALAVVTQTLRRHLTRRGTDVRGLEVRALVPVNIRGREDAVAAKRTGNHVAMLVVALPVGEADPRRALERIHERSKALKEGSHEIEAAQLAEELSELGPDGLLGVVFSIGLRLLPFQVVATNVPGPPVPLYLGPAKLEALYPLVPLFARQSLGVALVSYDGGMFVGVNADRAAVPDLEQVLDDLEQTERALAEAVLGPDAR